MGRRSKFPLEVRERAVRLVLEQEGTHESRWGAIKSIAEKIGCSSEALRNWVKQAETDTGKGSGLTTNDRERMKDLEREVRELRRANEIRKRSTKRVRETAARADRVSALAELLRTRFAERIRSTRWGPGIQPD